MNEKKQTPAEYLASGELPETERAIVAELVECKQLHKDFVADMAEAEKEREVQNKEWAEFDRELNEIDQALSWREDFYQDSL